MRPMLAGFVVAIGCSIFAMEAAAQSTYVNTSGGVYAAGTVVTGQVLSQPQAVGTVVGQPVVTGGIVGQPINSGVVTGGPVTNAGTTSIAPAQGQILPYSYWVSSPSRIYVEYGPVDQFPFHGRPYGSPNDRWSWYYMGGGPSRYLAKYYYPILQ